MQAEIYVDDAVNGGKDLCIDLANGEHFELHLPPGDRTDTYIYRRSTQGYAVTPSARYIIEQLIQALQEVQ